MIVFVVLTLAGSQCSGRMWLLMQHNFGFYDQFLGEGEGMASIKPK